MLLDVYHILVDDRSKDGVFEILVVLSNFDFVNGIEKVRLEERLFVNKVDDLGFHETAIVFLGAFNHFHVLT